MQEKELKQKCLGLMETAEVVYFSTVDDEGFPQTRAMANLRNKVQFQDLVDVFEEHKEDFLIYLTTDAASGKFKQIKANMKVSVYFCNSKQLMGLMLTGVIEVVTDQDIKKRLWQDDWKVYYPRGVDGPEYNILSLRPVIARCWFAPMPKPFTLKLQ